MTTRPNLVTTIGTQPTNGSILSITPLVQSTVTTIPLHSRPTDHPDLMDASTMISDNPNEATPLPLLLTIMMGVRVTDIIGEQEKIPLTGLELTTTRVGLGMRKSLIANRASKQEQWMGGAYFLSEGPARTVTMPLMMSTRPRG